MKEIVSLFAAFALVTATAPATSAQQAGSLRGTVTSAEKHAPIARARVRIASPEREAIADDAGRFTMRDVPAGSYTVFTTALGMKRDSSTVTVDAGAPTTLDVALQQGSLLLSSVIVSATRSPVEASQVTSTVNVLTPEQVRQSPARETQDLLREIPAVELPRTSSLVGGAAQIVSIRGVDEGRTAVLFDGIPVNDAWGEWIDWGRMPKSMIDRVEVVEGGQSNLYGNGALGGLISFFSRTMNPGSGDIQIDGGSRDGRHAYIAAGIPIVNGITANINGDYQEKGGYRLIGQGAGPIDVTSNVIQRNSYLRFNYAASPTWTAFVTGHLFGDSRQLGTPLTFDNRDQRNVDVGFNANSLGGGMLAVRAWDGRMLDNQRASAIRSAMLRNAEDSSLTASIPSHDWGGSAQWTRAGLWHLESLAFGADFRHYQGDFNEVDFGTSGCPIGATCGTVTQHVSSGGNQSLSGAFAQAIAYPVAPLRIELSARVDEWQNNGGHSLATNTAGVTNPQTYANRSKGAFSPRLGARYQLLPTLALRAAVYKAFRAPNLAELYRKQVSSTSITIPNPNLSPETALGREVGLDWQPVEWVQLKGAYYVAEYHDFNSPVALTATSNPPRPADCGAVATCRTRLNIGQERSQGGEAYLALRPIRELFLTAAVNYDNDRQQSNLPAGTTSKTKPHVNRVPSPKQTIRGTWSSAMLGDWTAIWRHEGRTTTLQGVWLDAYTVVDANAQRDLVAGVRGFVSIENLTDRSYPVNVAGAGTAASPFVFTQGLPRTVRVGVEAYRF